VQSVEYEVYSLLFLCLGSVERALGELELPWEKSRVNLGADWET